MRKGMTLTEILVAAGLTLLLASVMMLGVLDARRRSRDAETVSSVRQAQAAAEAYRARSASYPGQASDAPPGDSERLQALGYRAEPEGCAPDRAETCRSYVLRFTLGGRVGTLAGGTCEARPSGISCK